MMPRWLRRPLRKAVVYCFVWFSRRRGRRGLDAIRETGERFGDWHYRLRPFKRIRLQRQLARALGYAPGDAAACRVLRAAYRNCDRAVFEVLALSAGAITAPQLAEQVEVSGLESLEQSLKSGEGAVLLGMHMGNSIALMIHLAVRGLPVSIVVHQSRKLSSGFFESMFDSVGLQTIQARPSVAAYYKMARALKKGRAVFVTMDQAGKQGGVSAWFLGKQVVMPVGPAALARSVRVPVFPVLPLAETPTWKFRIGTPLHLSESNSLEQDVAELTGVMDTHIRAYPELWSWHHRRWSRDPFPEPGRDSQPTS